MSKDATYKRLIGSRRWQLLRRAVLTAHPLCEECEREGYVTPATEVHHVIPCENATNTREMENLMFDDRNLMALCHYHHVQKHMEMGRSGKAAAKRKNEEHLSRVVARFFGETPGGVF